MSEAPQNYVVGDFGAGREKSIPVNYPSNSKNPKGPRPEKDVKKVTTGEVIQRKRGIFARSADHFVGDSTGSVGEFIALEVLLPAFKSMIVDAISQGAERLFYGSVSRSGRGAPTNYSRISSKPDGRDLSRRARAGHDFNEFIFSNRAEADDVLDRLRELISTYEVATVADFYDLVGTSSSFTDNKWGWYNLRDATIRNTRHGYIIQLPRTEQVDG